MAVFDPLIEEAWEHRRRRLRRFCAMLLVVLLLGAVAVWFAANNSGSSATAWAAVNYRSIPPTQVLGKPGPYFVQSDGHKMPHGIRFERMTARISLKRPAASVTGETDGVQFKFTAIHEPAGLAKLSGGYWYTAAFKPPKGFRPVRQVIAPKPMPSWPGVKQHVLPGYGQRILRLGIIEASGRHLRTALKGPVQLSERHVSP